MAGFSVVISATDRLTGTLDKINKKAAAFGAPFKKAQASLDKFTDVTGLKNVGKSFGDIAGTARDAFQKIGQIVAPLGVISGAASVAGMYRLVSAWSEWGTQLGFAAQNMALTASQLGNLQGAARLAGASAGALTNGMQTLGQTMFDAVGGRNAEAVVMFNTLGISFRDATGHARNAAAVMPELMDRIKAAKDPFVQAKIAVTTFGSAGMELLPFLRQGSEGFRQLQVEAAKYNPVTQQSIDSANDFRVAQTRLTLSTEGLRNRIATGLSPALTPMMNQFSTWLATSPAVQHATDYLTGSVKQFGDYLKGVDWDRVERGMERWGDRIKYVVGLLGGPGAVIRDLFILMVGGFALKVLAPWARLGVTIAGATWKLGAYLLKLREVTAAETAAAAVPAWQRKGVFPGGIGGGGATTAAETAAASTASVAATASEAKGAAKLGGKLVRLGGKLFLVGDAFSAGYQVGDFLDDLTPVQRVVDAVTHPFVRGGQALGILPSDGMASDMASDRAARRIGPMATTAGAARPSSAEQAKLAQDAVSYFVGKGWTPAQAAGIAVSAMQESGFNPRAVGDNGTAYGSGQWHADRRRAIEQHFGKSLSQMTLEEQFGAMNWELREGGEQAAGRRLALATDARSAGAVVSQFYERPGDVEGEKARRGAMADQIASRFAATVNAQGVAMQAPNTAPTGGTGTGDGTVTVRLEHANTPPPGFGATIAGTSGGLGGAQVAQANVMGTLP